LSRFLSPYAVIFVVYTYTVIMVLRSLRQPELTESVSRYSSARRVALLGLLTALAAAMQAAGVFLPMVGPVLAMLSSLPVALGTLLAPQDVPWMVLATGVVLLVIHVPDAIVFMLTMGPTGLTAAWALNCQRTTWQRILVPAVVLSGGMLVITFIIGLPTFAGVVQQWGTVGAIAIFAVFGLLYSVLWIRVISRFNRLMSGFLRPGA
jgi:hypothetical protein